MLSRWFCLKGSGSARDHKRCGHSVKNLIRFWKWRMIFFITSKCLIWIILCKWSIREQDPWLKKAMGLNWGKIWNLMCAVFTEVHGSGFWLMLFTENYVQIGWATAILPSGWHFGALSIQWSKSVTAWCVQCFQKRFETVDACGRFGARDTSEVIKGVGVGEQSFLSS